MVLAEVSSQLPAAALSLTAAVIFVWGLALQQKGNLAAMQAVGPDAPPLRSLLATVRQPRWLIGFGFAGFVGFVLVAAALRIGSLTVVQVLQVTQMIFTLPFSAWVAHTRVQRRDWVAAVVLVVGLALVLGVLHPEPGSDVGDPARWAVVVPALLVVAVVLFVAGRARAAYAAALFGASAGVLFALQGACTKEAVALLGDGFTVSGFVASGAPWGAVLFVPAAVVVQNLALRAGRLSAAQTTLVTVSPVVATLIGIVVFGEQVSASPAAWVAAAAGGGAVVWGVAHLARSPSLLAAAALADGEGSARPAGSAAGAQASPSPGSSRS